MTSVGSRTRRRLSAPFATTQAWPGRFGDGHGGFGLSLLVKPKKQSVALADLEPMAAQGSRARQDRTRLVSGHRANGNSLGRARESPGPLRSISLGELTTSLRQNWPVGWSKGTIWRPRARVRARSLRLWEQTEQIRRWMSRISSMHSAHLESCGGPGCFDSRSADLEQVALTVVSLRSSQQRSSFEHETVGGPGGYASSGMPAGPSASSVSARSRCPLLLALPTARSVRPASV